ncbi:hypothetical protein SAMN04489752_2061 [Brevibacterium siliguriense]|uniref:Uncharacterized protein n=1 Tax=Brevibacterium siliguriense TaxID=1136497 RepID=A0A1H1TI04_9MICO|nr:hypothetical protein [Brevibacterium siliguriense]SDS59843.1 hypothetical protein SAMN04489752_2061 [Brevibacterium siliguriense]
MRRLIISLVQSINGSFAEDDWSTGVSTDADFRHFLALRRSANAIIIDRRTALNPQLPVINAAGKTLEHTPVYVLTESDPESLQSELDAHGLDYRAQHFSADTITEVAASLPTAPSPNRGSPALPRQSRPRERMRRPPTGRTRHQATRWCFCANRVRTSRSGCSSTIREQSCI